MHITASAPGKIMLAGGYAVVHGEPCIVSAVDQRLFVTVKKNGTDVFHFDAPDLGLQAYSKTISDLGNKELPKAVRFIEILYKQFLAKHPQQEGISVVTKSDFSDQFGFGSSSAVTVAFAKALTTLYELELTDKELFSMCYETILEVQGVGSGFDLAAAIWGKTLYYVSPAKVVEVLPLTELPLVVGYTGVKADTPTLIRMVNTTLEKEPERIGGIFAKIGAISDQLRAAINIADWQTVGSLLSQHQRQATELGVSSVELENLITAAENAGSYGATLSGAGGGDCMVAVVSETTRTAVEEAIKKAGGTVMHVNLNADGVRIEGNGAGE